MEGIERNEAADVAAKEATGGREGQDYLLPPRATLERDDGQQEFDKTWQISWREDTKGRSLR